MPDADPNAHPIPESWRKRVAEILRRGVESEIISTQSARRDWADTFPDEPWNYVRYEAMALALDQPLLGRRITDMNEPGEVWAFWFHHRSRQLYAKINLTSSGKVLLYIYSNHIPRRGQERL